MKRLRLLFVACCIVTFCNAQEIKVKKIELLRTDISARTNPRLDGNDEPCALIKVIVPTVEGMQFGGWVIGNIGYLPGEYHVYVPAGTKKITFRHPDYAPGEIRFTIPIEGKCTYRVVLEVPQKVKGLESVEQGDAASMLKMAQNYEKGTGAYNKNIQQALEWYEKAAEAGSIEAQEYLAEVLYEGKNGFQKNDDKALKWNEACGNRGNMDAMLRAANIYEHSGKKLQAAKWYEQLDNKKPSDRLQFRIAYLYEDDSLQRNSWLKKSAESGNAEAAYYYAMSQLAGNKAEAVVYFKKAISKDYVKAMEDYGRMLFYGENGMEKDIVEGERLLEMASSRGSNNAKVILDTNEMLKKQDAQMAAYVSEIPQLTIDAKNGDIEAFYKLYLIYDASGNREMAYRIKIALYYNCIITHPRNKPDELLSQKAVRLTFENILMRYYREAVTGVIAHSKTIMESAHLTKECALYYYEKDCMDFLVNRWKYEYMPFDSIYGKAPTSINNQFDYKIAVARLDYLNSKTLNKFEKKEKKDLEILLSTANIEDKDKEYTPWIRQLFDDGYLWSQAIQEKAYRIEQQKQEEEARNAQLAKEAAWKKIIDNHKIIIKERGKRTGVRTFEVRGVPFNMVLVKPNPKAKYSDWNSGVTDYAPKASYYIAETEVTQELWNAVMGESSKSNILQHTTDTYKLHVIESFINTQQQPKYIRDTNKWLEFETFINKLNKLTGKRFRVPTHTEWEYAAHGGALTGSPYCIDRHTADEYRFKDYQVAQGTPNELGLYDILTGVMEFNKRPNDGRPSVSKGYSDHYGLRLALSVQ